jgi:protein transport protein SEC13
MQGPIRRLATGGCDQGVRLWSQGPDGVWRPEGPPLALHTGWIRDLAFAPNLGLPQTCIATAGQDGKVVAWVELAANPGSWKPTVVKDYGPGMPAWSVSWSTAGTVLAVSAAGEDEGAAVTELFKETSSGKWEPVVAADGPQE